MHSLEWVGGNVISGIACYIWAAYCSMIIQRTSNSLVSWFFYIYICGLWCRGLLFSVSSLHILKLEHTTYNLVFTYTSRLKDILLGYMC